MCFNSEMQSFPTKTEFITEVTVSAGIYIVSLLTQPAAFTAETCLHYLKREKCIYSTPLALRLYWTYVYTIHPKGGRGGRMPSLDWQLFCLKMDIFCSKCLKFGKHSHFHENHNAGIFQPNLTINKNVMKKSDQVRRFNYEVF